MADEVHVTVARAGVDPARLAQVLPDGLLVVDADLRVTFVNEVGAGFIGATPSWCLGRSVVDFVHPDDLTLVLTSLEAVRGKQRGTPVEVRLRGPSGGWRLFEVIGSDHLTTPGVEGVVCCVRDLTERRMWEVAQGDVHRFAHIVQHAAAIVMTVGVDGAVTSVNGAFGRLLGHDPSHVVGRALADFAAAGQAQVVRDAIAASGLAGSASAEVPLLAAAGDPVPVRLEVVDLSADPTVGCLVVTAMDISDLHEARVHLEHLASHDPLTGLPNRTLLDARLDELLAAGRTLALCFVDLDGFKAVNDTWGHGAGDELLTHVARRLADGVAAGDLVARVGGDEFVVVAVGVDAPGATAVAARLGRLLGSPYRLASAVVTLTASVGVVAARPGATAAGLLADADRAMYDAKAGRGD